MRRRRRVRIRQGDFAGCDVLESRSSSGSSRSTANHYRLTGTVEQPVQIDCDEFQLFADSASSISGPRRRLLAERTHRLRLWHQPHLCRAARLQHPHAHRHVLRRGRHGGHEAGRAVRHRRRAGTLRVLLGRRAAQAWSDEIQDRAAAVHSLRATDAALGDLVRLLRINIDDYVCCGTRSSRSKAFRCSTCRSFYYPMEEDDRSTGFLMPSYGTATLAGQTLTNAFFWAIGRSHDATFSHDWFTKTGYALSAARTAIHLGSASSGYCPLNRLSEKERRRRSTAPSALRRRRQSYIRLADRAAPARTADGARRRELFLQPGVAAALPAERVSCHEPDSAITAQT